MGLGHYVLMDPEDLPTKKELKESINRLRRDYEILKDFSPSKHKCDPKSVLAIAKFLEHLLERESARLKEGGAALCDEETNEKTPS